MKAQTLRDYLAVHTWVGIVSGLLLFIAFYAGAFSMLEPAITRWTEPPSARPPASADADAAVAAFFAQHPRAKGRLSLRLPAPGQPTPLLRLSQKDDERWFELGQDGQLRELRLVPEADSSGNFVDYLHRKGGLPLPLDWAEPVIGIVSLLYALALISGVVVLLPSLVKDLLHMRLGANFKRKWLDVHNVVGVASLPFHVVIALSAAVFGLHDWIYAAQDRLVYREGLRAVVQRDSPRPPVVSEDPAQWLKPSALVERIRAQAPGFEPVALDYLQLPGARQRTLFVAGRDERYFQRGAQYGFGFASLQDGTLYNRTYLPGPQDSALAAWLSSFFSLHFGSYGGQPVRILYVLLGLGGALLFYTGNLLWVESRTKRPRQQPLQRPRHVRVMSGITLGVCLGCAAGLPLALAASRWLAPGLVAGEPLRQGLFYAVLSASVLWALRQGSARAARPLLWLCAAANAAVPLTALLAAAGLLPGGIAPRDADFLPLELLCLALAAFFGWLALRTIPPPRHEGG